MHALFALLFPRALAASRFLIYGLYRFLGLAITTLLLSVLYFLVATPIAIVARLRGRDQIAVDSREPRWHDVPERVNDPKQIERLY